MPAEFTSSRRNPSWLIGIAAAAILALATAVYFMLTASVAAPNVAFTNLNGEKISFNHLRGKVVLVNFWATSCAICMHEMPQMVQTYNQFKGKGLEFVAVAMNYDSPNYVLNYAQTRNLPFNVVLDPQGEIAQAFGGVNATPTTFLIGKDGNIIKRYVGELEFAALHQLLDKTLAVPG